MKSNRIIPLMCGLVIVLAACAPSLQAIQTANAKTQAANPTLTFTPVPPTETPTKTPTQVPTETPTKTPTLAPLPTLDLLSLQAYLKEFLVQESDLPLLANYTPHFDSPLNVSNESVSQRLGANGNEYIAETGRMDGWELSFHYEGDPGLALPPLSLSSNVALFNTIEGAQLALAKDSDRYVTEYGFTEDVGLPSEIGDVTRSFYLLYQEKPDDSRQSVKYIVVYSYRNVLETVQESGLYTDPIFLMDIAQRLLARLKAPISTPMPESTHTPTAMATSTPTPLSSGRIVFSRFMNASADIYVMNADGSGLTRLTDRSGYSTSPLWSPDGTKILFVFREEISNCMADLYVMNADGSRVTRLTDNTAVVNFPRWSPHGTKIVFKSNHGGNEEIHVINVDGSGEANLSFISGPDTLPYWSPDGTKILFTSRRDGNEEVYVMNADGSGQTNLSNNPGMDNAIDAWSPDGSKIAFTSDRTGNSDVFVVNVDGSGLINLTNKTSRDWYPKWSPDGKRIAFLSDRNGPVDIYKMNADGSGVTKLTNLPENEGYLTWSPDGTRIAFVYDNNIHVVNADGSGQTALTNSPGYDSELDWTLTRDGSQPVDCSAGWTRLSVGKFAIVAQGDLTNRVRSEPKVGDNIIHLLYPGDIVKIFAGPVCANGLVFWKVENAAIPGGTGWTAEGDGKEYWLEPYTP